MSITTFLISLSNRVTSKLTILSSCVRAISARFMPAQPSSSWRPCLGVDLRFCRLSFLCQSLGHHHAVKPLAVIRRPAVLRRRFVVRFLWVLCSLACSWSGCAPSSGSDSCSGSATSSEDAVSSGGGWPSDTSMCLCSRREIHGRVVWERGDAPLLS